MTLSIRAPAGNTWPRLRVDTAADQLIQLDASSDFTSWTNIATTHETMVDYPDARIPGSSPQFYRARWLPLTQDDDWKNQIHSPDDPFQSLLTGLVDEIRWVKFAILLDQPHRVYYQHSGRYLFHYDFATEKLEPFVGMGPTEFDQATLYTNGQQALLGAVLFPPPPNEAEYGIQIVGQDPYPKETVRRSIDLVRATVVSDPGVRAIYVPTFEQQSTVEANPEYFAAHGIHIGSIGLWLGDDQAYSSGWALGRLTFVTAEDIDDAYTDGTLRPTDVLLTDAIPAEIPFVAGVVSMSPATPNSHVAILARSFGIPFGFLADDSEQARALSLAGRKVILRVQSVFGAAEVRMIDVQDILTPELEAELLARKLPPALNIQPKQPLGAISAPTDALTPADIRHFGGKAANYGFLRRAIPTNSRPAIAFSFDLWDDFMNQVMTGGQTLRTVISNRLAGYTYPPDIAAMREDLDDIRDMIEDNTVFTTDQRTAIIDALMVFDPNRKIRFRSSTNLEDTEHFTGAGLYDSYSGCLLDDLDGDSTGPSLCDPENSSERGVFRAIRKVFAGFYNDNAFLERLRHGIDEADVGMAVLVHHSFPDETELANGVAALEVKRFNDGLQLSGDVVTQKGAVPVANPEGTATPEVVQLLKYAGQPAYVSPKQHSSLVPLGGYVLAWNSEYHELANLFDGIAGAYAEAFPLQEEFILDFEFKKADPDGLVVKQVREIPLADAADPQIPILLNEPAAFCTFQGEGRDVFSPHRLKSRWMFESRSLLLGDTNITESLFADAGHSYANGTRIDNLSGRPADWPNAAFVADGDSTTDSWSEGEGADRREYQLVTYVPTGEPGNDPPIWTVSDLRMEWSVTYATPQPAFDLAGNPVTVTNERIRLMPCPVSAATDLKQVRTVESGSGAVVIQIEFYWPKAPDFSVGYTAPLVRWERTVITGLVSEPIELRGWYSQTYRPEHHNFTERFIFEPALEPDLPPTILQELDTQNIRLVYVKTGLNSAPPAVLGFDGQFRTIE